MADSDDEIAMLFEAELRDLDNCDDDSEGDSDDDFGLKKLEALGAQLKQSLARSDDNENDEDADADLRELMASRAKQATHLQAVQDNTVTEEMVNPRDDKTGPSLEDELLLMVVEGIKGGKAGSPGKNSSPGTSHSPRSPEGAESKKNEPTLPQRQEVLTDLMDSMLTGVESVVSLSLSLSRPVEVARDASSLVDLARLPQVLVDDDEEEEYKKHKSLKGDGTYGYSAARTERYTHAEKEEQRRTKEALEYVRRAEEAFQKEEAEAAEALESDRLQRLQRKQRMVDEMVRAKRAKCALRIQTLIRGAVARRTRKTLALELVVEKARLVEAERKEKEAEFLLAETTKQDLECEAMRDADLETMQHINEEALVRERERREFEGEEVTSDQLRKSESLVMRYADECEVADNKKEVLSFFGESFLPAVENRVREEESRLRDEVEENDKHAREVWGHYGGDSRFKESDTANDNENGDGDDDTADGDGGRNDQAAKPLALRASQSEKILGEMNKTWGYFSKLHPIDRDFDEMGIWEFHTQKYIDKYGDPAQREVGKMVYEAKRREAPDTNYTGGNTTNFVKELYNPEKAFERSMYDHWNDLAREAVSHAAADVALAINKKNNTSDVSVKVLQKPLQKAFATKPETSQVPEILISPRAKVGMRVMSARNVSSQGVGTERSTLILSDPLTTSLSLGVVRGKEEIMRNGVVTSTLLGNSTRKTEAEPVLLASSHCPLTASLLCWQQTLKKHLSPRSNNNNDDNDDNDDMYANDHGSDIDVSSLNTASRGVHEILNLAGIDHQDHHKAVSAASPRSPRAKAGANFSNNFDDDDEEEEEEAEAKYVASPNSEADLETLEYLGLRGDSESIASLELNVEGLHSSSFLKNFRNLQKLQINVNKLCSLDGLRGMACLEDVSAKDNSLVNIDALKGDKALKTVMLDTNNITSLAAIRNLPNLEVLSCNTNKLQDLESIISTGKGTNVGLPKLQKLQLYHNSIISVSKASLKNMPSLLHLDLGRNKLETICGDALSQCHLLQTLVLSQNKLTQVPAPLRLPQLKTLWLSGNCLEDLQGWCPVRKQASADSSGSESRLNSWDWPVFTPMLEKLLLQDNRVRLLDPTALLAFPHLTELDISFNDLRAVDNVQGLAVLPNLQILQIQENPITSTTNVAVNAELNEYLSQTCTQLSSISGERLPLSSASTISANNSDRPTSNHLMALATESILSTSQHVPGSSCGHATAAANSNTAICSSSGSNTSTTFQNQNGSLSLHQLNKAVKYVLREFMGVGLADFRPGTTYSNTLNNSSESASSQDNVSVSGSPSRSTNNSAASSGMQGHSIYSSQLLQYLSNVVAEQNVYKTNEKAEKRVIDVAKNKNNGVLSSEQLIFPQLDKKESLPRLLQKHHDDLLDWTDMEYSIDENIQAPHLLNIQSIIRPRRENTNFLPNKTRTQQQPVQIRGMNKYQKRSAAAKHIQKMVRGALIRMHVRKALDSAKYEDNEIDDMFMEMENEHGDVMGDMGIDDLLAAPELHDDYFANHLRPAPDQMQDDQQYQQQPQYHHQQPQYQHQQQTQQYHQQQQYYDNGDNGYGDGSNLDGGYYDGGNHGQGQLQDVSQMSTYSEGPNAPSPNVGNDGGQRAPMVYGDHRRRNNQQQQVRGGGGDYYEGGGGGNGDSFQDAELQPSSWMDDGRHLPPLTHAQQQHIVEEQFVPPSPYSQSVSQQISPRDRPTSAMTDSSEVTNDDNYQLRYGGGGGEFMGGVAMGAGEIHSARNNASGARAPLGQVQLKKSRSPSKKQEEESSNALAEEWGIQDPKVLAMMMKRSKKIKAGAGASGQSNKQRTATSSSFGGKPKIARVASKSSTKKVVPAWAKGSEGQVE